MDTFVLLPADLSLMLAPHPRRVLEMRVGVWSSVTLEPGVILQPEQGEPRMERLEVYCSLPRDDIRFKFGCSESVHEVDGVDVRHCNWVRFLASSDDLEEVNMVATLAHGQPVYQIVKKVEPLTELKVYFEPLAVTASDHSARQAVTMTTDSDEEIDVVRDSGYETKSLSAITDSALLTTPAQKQRFPIFRRPWLDTPEQTRSRVLTDRDSSFLRPLTCLGGLARATHAQSLLTEATPQRGGRRSVEGSPPSDDEARSVKSGSSDSSGGGSHCDRSPVDYSTPIRPPPRAPLGAVTSPPALDTSTSPVSSSASNSPESETLTSPPRPAFNPVPMPLVTSDPATHTPLSVKQDLTGTPVTSYPVKRARERTMLPCEVCSKKFDRPSLLRRHMRTHTGEKPHACDVCGKAFSTSSSLNTHRRIHTGEKPHKCPVCNKLFTASSNLYYHKMTHYKEKPHKCQLCAKSFPTPGDLKSHMYVHNGSWPFKCDVCSRGFSKQTNLKNHMMLHTGDKPYSCELCGKRFSLQCNLKSHQKTHEDEPQEQCKKCKKSFLVIQGLLLNGHCRHCFDKADPAQPGLYHSQARYPHDVKQPGSPQLLPFSMATKQYMGLPPMTRPLIPYPPPGAPWPKLVMPNF